MQTRRIERGRDEVAVRPAPATGEILGDLRFRTLLGAEAWAALPAEVRSRFSRRLRDGDAITYAGEIVESQRRAQGWWLAQAARLIGAPLPLGDEVDTAAVVALTEDARTGGQVWTRVYGRRRGFPQVIHSSKRFAGPTGLEEYLGCGFGIALTVRAESAGLHFLSDHYFLALGRWRLRLPRWLSPAALTVSHLHRDDGRFAFVLSLRHPLGGEILRQTGLFHERRNAATEALRHD